MQRRNIILITVDCLRADFLGCYGNREGLTPNLDRVAKKGVLFEDVVANGSDTSSSLPSLFMSRLPNMLHPDLPSIISALKEVNYITVAFNPNVLMLLDPRLKPHLKFDFYYTFLSVERKFIAPYVEMGLTRLGSTIINLFGEDSSITRLLVDMIGVAPFPIDRPCPTADYLNEKAISWLKNHEEELEEKNFFMWLHYMDVHEPLLPPYLLPFNSINITKTRIAWLNRKRR